MYCFLALSCHKNYCIAFLAKSNWKSNLWNYWEIYHQYRGPFTLCEKRMSEREFKKVTKFNKLIHALVCHACTGHFSGKKLNIVLKLLVTSIRVQNISLTHNIYDLVLSWKKFRVIISSTRLLYSGIEDGANEALRTWDNWCLMVKTINVAKIITSTNYEITVIIFEAFRMRRECLSLELYRILRNR